MNHERKIQAIIDSDANLEKVTMALISNSVARADISVEDNSPTSESGTKEPFLSDDFGWVIGLAFAIPIFICLVLGIFVIGDIRSTHDNLLYGVIGLVVGSAIGAQTSLAIKKHHALKLKRQEKKGGFMMWITTHTDEQYQSTLQVLKAHGVRIC